MIATINSEEKLYDIIGENIKYYRLLHSLENEKLTQEKLAELSDVSTTMIGSLESKKTKQGLSIYTLYKISNVLNVPIGKFLVERKK